MNDATTTYELADAHAELVAGLSGLERLTNMNEIPDPAILARARWKLAAAARRRLLLVTRILAACRRTVETEDAPLLDEVARDIDGLQGFTRAYVQIWTRDAVMLDWEGYRAASRMKRELLERSIQLDRLILMPRLRPTPMASASPSSATYPSKERLRAR